MEDYKKFKQLILISIPILFAICSIFHFIYDILFHNPLIGAFAPINESVFEHTKMLTLPLIAYYLILADYYKKLNVRLILTGGVFSLIISTFTIPMLYYFYTSAFGIESLIVDILILFVAITIGQLTALSSYKKKLSLENTISIIVFLAFLIFNAICTFYPPNIPYFTV